MTIDSDVGAVYAAYRTALTDGAALWGTKAYADDVPRNTSGGVAVTRPYVIYSFAGGGDASDINQPDPDLLVDVIGVADNVADALLMAQQIRERLDDHGELDATMLAGSSTYMLKTITHEMRIHFIERALGTLPIFHSGGRYRNILEKR